MDFTPHIETREMSDEALDNVSGGIHSPIVGDFVGTFHEHAPGDINSTFEKNTDLPASGLSGLAGS